MINDLKITQLRFLHVLVLILIVSVAITAIFNTTLFSKANLIEVIQYSANTSNISISPLDSLYMARLIRQQLWQVHFYIGALLPIVSIILQVLYVKIALSVIRRENKERIKSVVINNIVLLYMSVVGILMFYRKELSLSNYFVDILRDMHWVGIYAFGGAVIYHIFTLLYSRGIR